MQKNKTRRDVPAITAAKSARGMAADLQDELQYAGNDYPLSDAMEQLQAIENALAKVEGAKKTIEEARLAAAALGRSLEAGKRTNASTPAERFEALQKAHALGLRTYGMLCLCPPGVSDRREHVEV